MTRSGTRRRAPVLALSTEMMRVSPALTAALALLVALTAALPVGLAVAVGVLTSALTSTPRVDVHTASVIRPVLVLGVVFLLLQVLPPLAQALAETLGRRVSRSVRTRVLAALDRSPDVARLEDPAVGDLVSAINGGLVGTGMRDAVVGLTAVGIMRGGAILGAVLLAAFAWWLAPVLLGAFSFAMVLVSRMYQRALESAEGAPALMRRVVYLRDLAATPAAGKEIRTFGLGGWLAGRYRAEFRSAIALARGERSAVGRVSLASGAIVLAGEALTFVLLARGLMDGSLTIARFTVFAIAAAGLVGLASVTPDLLNITVGGAMADDVHRLEERLAGPGDRAGTAGPPLRGAIVFEDVGFRYPGSDRWVLRHLDLTVRAGASMSVVGVNGAGKTTLVKLLCGLYRPTEGRILIDGVDLAGLDVRAWQRRFAALFQDWVRWALPLRDNVLLGAPQRAPQEGELDAVARGAGLSDVVAGLPAGWDTILSREFGGSDLSGGQWQRVGLARALWALGGADVLILDEPTSALDVRGELELFDTLLAAAPGKTIVLVSHRFSTVRHTDHIVVLADGRVREQGGHAELTLAEGMYARMFAAQANRFVTDGEPR